VGAVQAVRDDVDELVEVERLEDRIADGAGGDLVDAALAGGREDHDVRPVAGISFADLLDELVSVEPGHHEIEQDEIEAAVVLQFFETGRAVFRQVDVEFHAPQHGLQQHADRQVIIDDEDATPTAIELLYRHVPSWCYRLNDTQAAYRPEEYHRFQSTAFRSRDAMSNESTVASGARMAVFPFRPWVRRAGWSIVFVAAILTAAIAAALVLVPSARYGWIGEPFVWVYVGTLWVGGAKVWLGTRRPVAEIGDDAITLRPLHQFRTRILRWDAITGTEQMIGGDRLIVYVETPRGMRFVALNLNLVKGRREFLTMVDERLRARGFQEKIVERSRYLTRRRA